VLRPRGEAGGTFKAISRDVALLLYALQTPGLIPRQAVAGGDASVLDAAWRLTLDGVLEVERGGAFVSGAGALNDADDGTPVGVVASLSRQALRLVARVDEDDPVQRGRRLYQFNRRPLTPRWAERLRTPGEVLRFAGASAGSTTAASLERHWTTSGVERGAPWLSWWPREAGRNRRRVAASAVTHKVYVSPRAEDVPAAFPTLVEVLADIGAPPFKIGASAPGILRPDKIVTYFAGRDDAEGVAKMLATALRQTPAQPVPFTHQVGAAGLVSLGIDPPAGGAGLARSGLSWRQWICRRLGSYLCVAARTGHASDADRFALARIALDGVDPSTWEPSEEALRGFIAGTPP